MLMIVIGAVLAISSLVAGWIGYRSKSALKILDGAGAAAFLLVMTIIGTAVLRTIMNGTVFMTEIHAILLNPIFLTAGSYLSVYVLARIGLNFFYR